MLDKIPAAECIPRIAARRMELGASYTTLAEYAGLPRMSVIRMLTPGRRRWLKRENIEALDAALDHIAEHPEVMRSQRPTHRSPASVRIAAATKLRDEPVPPPSPPLPPRLSVVEYVELRRKVDAMLIKRCARCGRLMAREGRWLECVDCRPA